MKDDQTPNDKNGTPSPYQHADQDVEVTEVHYFSPSKGEGVFLGKTIRKISRDGKVSYTLIDPTDRIIGPDLPDEETVRQVWATIAGALEHRAKELGKIRKEDDKDIGKER